jgi:hypothetical protein
MMGGVCIGGLLAGAPVLPIFIAPDATVLTPLGVIASGDSPEFLEDLITTLVVFGALIGAMVGALIGLLLESLRMRQHSTKVFAVAAAVCSVLNYVLFSTEQWPGENLIWSIGGAPSIVIASLLGLGVGKQFERNMSPRSPASSSRWVLRFGDVNSESDWPGADRSVELTSLVDHNPSVVSLPSPSPIPTVPAPGSGNEAAGPQLDQIPSPPVRRALGSPVGLGRVFASIVFGGVGGGLIGGMTAAVATATVFLSPEMQSEGNTAGQVAALSAFTFAFGALAGVIPGFIGGPFMVLLRIDRYAGILCAAISAFVGLVAYGFFGSEDWTGQTVEWLPGSFLAPAICGLLAFGIGKLFSMTMGSQTG